MIILSGMCAAMLEGVACHGKDGAQTVSVQVSDVALNDVFGCRDVEEYIACAQANLSTIEAAANRKYTPGSTPVRLDVADF